LCRIIENLVGFARKKWKRKSGIKWHISTHLVILARKFRIKLTQTKTSHIAGFLFISIYVFCAVFAGVWVIISLGWIVVVFRPIGRSTIMRRAVCSAFCITAPDARCCVCVR